MLSQFQQLVNALKQPKNWLVLANIFLVFFLIVLGNVGVIPLQMGDFVFFSILSLAFALWRPSWAFLLFCGTVPLENINLAPVNLGMAIRPYQFIGAILVVAILIRLAGGRLNFKLAKLKVADYLVILMVVAGFVSAVAASVETRFIASSSGGASLRLAIIFGTFAILYFLVRNYVQSIDDAKKTIPFFLSSALVVTLYGLWQNIVFLHGGNSYEVMLGRPNATFAEADWLGAFIVLAITFIYTLLYYRHSERSEAKSKNLPLNTTSDEYIADPSTTFLRYRVVTPLRMTELFLYVLLTALYTILILTVSRSAWLAALVAFLIFIWIFFTDLRFKNWRLKETIYLKIKIFVALVASIAIVYVFHLTSFQLFNRVQSTGTGAQKITVSCDEQVNLPVKIEDVSELAQYGCRFINLEDIENEKAAGKFVTEIDRDDPTVNIRAEIYQKSWAEIKNHPVLGIGWGSIGTVLGRDGLGAVLNSSNIFLETWLGAGLLGILGILGLLGWILFSAIKNFFHAENQLQKAFYLFIIVSWFGLVIFNLFNAGIFLGFLWVWLSIGATQIYE